MNRRPFDPSFGAVLDTPLLRQISGYALGPAEHSAGHPRATRNKLRTLLGELQRQAYVDA